MAYCTRAEVESDFKNLTFTSSTNVTDTDVDQFIVEADALIDSFIGMRYSTPVTAGASAVSLLKLYSRTLVSERIKKIMEVNQATNANANQGVQGVRSLSTKDVMTMLADIRDGKTSLSGATLLDSGRGFYSENYAEDVTPTVTKDDKLW